MFRSFTNFRKKLTRIPGKGLNLDMKYKIPQINDLAGFMVFIQGKYFPEYIIDLFCCLYNCIF